MHSSIIPFIFGDLAGNLSIHIVHLRLRLVRVRIARAEGSFKGSSPDMLRLGGFYVLVLIRIPELTPIVETAGRQAGRRSIHHHIDYLDIRDPRCTVITKETMCLITIHRSFHGFS